MTTDRIVAITGGGGALGGALAAHLVGQGYKVALFDTKRAKDRLAQIVEQVGAGNALGHAGDFATATTWESALAATKDAFGAPPTHGVLVAGGWDGGAPLHEAKDDGVYQTMIALNVDTAYRALRSLLPSMVEKKHGSIVVVGSRAVERPWTSTGAAAYGASKAAVVSMAQAVAQEVLEHGVRINAILPSTMDTPANRAAMPSVDPATWVTLDSASSVVAFLLGEGARDVSGAAIPVYGRA